MYEVEASAGAIGRAVAAFVAIVEAVLDIFGIDLFGGGSRPTPPPMDYRFFHYPSGPFLGVPYAIMPNMLDSAAVEAATPFSSPLAAISDNPPSTSGNPYGGHLSKAQFPGYNYCGPGNNGGPAEPGTTDFCCKQHDECYDKQGLSAKNMQSPGPGASPQQQQCDAQLCKCVNGLTGASGPLDTLMQFGIREYFRCH